MTGFDDFGWTSADGLRLHARDYRPASDGGRLPVICLHGLTRNARDFEAVAPVIAAQGRRVLAASFRGRGQSAWAADPMTYMPPVYAGDILAIDSNSKFAASTPTDGDIIGAVALEAGVSGDLIDALIVKAHRYEAG